MDVAQTIIDTATRYGVNPALALEVATAESGMNPDTPDSSAGAIGIMQLMPATAASLGVNPRDPVQNIQGGVMLLQQLLSRFGDVREALAAYDWNPASVSAAIAKYGADWLAHAPGETQAYVAKIMGNLGSQYSVSIAPSAAPNDSPTSFRAGTTAEIPAEPSFSMMALLAAFGIFALWAFDEATG